MSPDPPPTPITPPTRNRRFLRITGRILFWLFFWFMISLVIPAVPSPLDALKGVLSLAKSTSDIAYYAFKGNALEEQSRTVTAAAAENDTTGKFAADRGAQEGLQRVLRYHGIAPPAVDDSALHATLRDVTRAPAVGGRVVNILILGVDARMGTVGVRADAIHLVSLNPDSGIVDIMSIPRGTYYDCGYPDTTTLNIISHARAKGIDRFMRAIEELTNRRPIRHYVEVGFSQALGVLELLGYKDPQATLRFLRSRKTFRTGDFQRSHNQGAFLRQSLVDRFDLLTGATGEVLLSAGLRFVNTNLTKDFCLGLVHALRKCNFPRNRPDAARLRMLPGFRMNLLDLLPDSANIARSSRSSDQLVGDQKAVGQNIAPRLREQIRLARGEVARPGKVVHRLRILVDQHIWIQIQDKEQRRALRDEAIALLADAYTKLGDTANADRVRTLKDAEDELLR